MDSPKRWALLIGIDYYIEGTERRITYQHLNGCVRDVFAIEKYLQNAGSCHIVKLTASDGGDKPAEDESVWPTHENIVNELKHISDTASPGDLVYIHYSGHGIRRDKLGTLDEEGDNISGTALVPTDVLIGGAYLTGYQLGIWIRNMVEDRKLRVTLVLDSCFSGRGMRNTRHTVNFAARTSVDRFDDSMLSSDKAADATMVATEIANTTDASHSFSEPVHRNAAVRQSWLSNPVGCTVLTACGVNETAGEDILGSEQGKNGVLTHWMLDILRRHPKGRPPTYTRVREHVASRIRSMVPKLRQSPVLYGDANYEFFGENPLVQRPACRILKKHDGYVELDIGRAQGAAEGTIYDVYPETWDIEWGPLNDDSGPKEINAPQVRVSKVSDFRAEAILLMDDDTTPRDMVVQPGSRAVLRSWALEPDIYIQFDCPPDRPDLEVVTNSLRMDIENTPGLYLCTNDSAAKTTFRVSVNQQQHFNFYDEKGGQLSRVLKVSLDDTDWAKKLAYIIRHLARFQAIQCLQHKDTRSSLSPDSFTFELLNVDEKPLPKAPSGKYKVNEGQWIIISFANVRLLRPVHVTFFTLNATWGIEKIHPQGQQTSEEALDNEPVQTQVDMEIPGKASDEDALEIDDMIRAYIYVGEYPVLWDELALPDLPAEAALVRPDLPVEAVLQEDPLLEASWMTKVVKNQLVKALEGKWVILDLVVHTSPPVEPNTVTK